MSIRARTARRLRASAVAAVGAAALAVVGAAGTAAADPPPTNPALAVVQGGWFGMIVGEQDRPDCQGRYGGVSASSFDTFRESKETYWSYVDLSDPRYQAPSNNTSAVFYLHSLRDISISPTAENGAIDGTYAVFDDTTGVAIADGLIQGVTKRRQSYLTPTEETFNGILYGGRVLRPSGATIGYPHLVANFESTFFGYSTQRLYLFGDTGGADGSGPFGPPYTAAGDRPAVVAQGGCPGAYKASFSPNAVTTEGLPPQHPLPSPAVLARERAYVQTLYNSTR